MLPGTNSAATATATAGPKVLRIWVTDADATDSSSDEDEPPLSRRKMVKRYINEVRLEPLRARDNGNRNGSLNGDKKRKTSGGGAASGKQTESDNTKRGGGGNAKKFRGVRLRPWGRWVAEIRDPSTRGRLWLGTYDTAEEAAMVYDNASIKLLGPDAITNFTTRKLKVSTSLPESTSSGYNSGREPQNNLRT